jgi:hypothetical protein
MKACWLTTMSVVFPLLFTIDLWSQETVAASGGNATGSGGTASFTVGQVVYTTNSGSTGAIAQGVQQPYEIYTVTGVEEAVGINLEMEVYPNPASDFLKLVIADYNLENLTCQLYDSNGGLIQNSKIINKETIIYTGDLAPAVYFLKVTDNYNEIKTFKIIKK